MCKNAIVAALAGASVSTVGLGDSIDLFCSAGGGGGTLLVRVVPAEDCVFDCNLEVAWVSTAMILEVTDTPPCFPRQPDPDIEGLPCADFEVWALGSGTAAAGAAINGYVDLVSGFAWVGASSHSECNINEVEFRAGMGSQWAIYPGAECVINRGMLAAVGGTISAAVDCSQSGGGSGGGDWHLDSAGLVIPDVNPNTIPGGAWGTTL